MPLQTVENVSTPQPEIPRSFHFSYLLVVGLTILFATIATGSYWLKKQMTSPIQVACTKDAKICPDGSGVGRIGPNCDFAPCPVTQTTPLPIADETLNWKTYTNTEYKYSLKYPPDYKADSCRNCADLSKMEFINFTPQQYPAQQYGIISVETVFKNKKPDETIDQYLRTILLNSNPVISGSEERFNINEFEALSVITENFGYQTKIVTLVNIERKQAFNIIFTGVSSETNKNITLEDFKNLNIFSQILSTFKFTD